MRYFVVPESVSIDTITLPNGKNPEISFKKLIHDVLVTHADVTKSDETIGRFLDIAEKCGAPVGAVVALTDEEHELLSSIARTFAYSPDAKLAILRLVKVITGAVSRPVTEAKAAE